MQPILAFPCSGFFSSVRAATHAGLDLSTRPFELTVPSTSWPFSSSSSSSVFSLSFRLWASLVGVLGKYEYFISSSLEGTV